MTERPSDDRGARGGERTGSLADAALAAIIESAHVAIISKTLDGIIVSWNAAAERMFGYTAEEAIGKPILMLLPADRAAEEAMILEKLRNGIRVDHFETVRVTRDGRRIDVSLTSSPVKDSSGKVIGASKIVRDITDRKRTEAALRQQEAAIEHLGRQNTMGEMAAGLAHELNQPLASILNYAGGSLSAIQNGGATAESLVPGLQEIMVETRRASEIIRRLRSFIRKHEPRRESADINAMVTDAVHMLEYDLKQAAIRLEMSLSPEVPPVFVDQVQMVQVMVNLLRNARDAMVDPAAKGRELRVASFVCKEGVRVDVSDNGCGVSSEHLERLFNPFFSTKPQGLGMGLAISRTIVNSTGGQLTATRNTQQGGMTFSVTLPRH
jgi:two-component system sensor kinase FixL